MYFYQYSFNTTKYNFKAKANLSIVADNLNFSVGTKQVNGT